jgi:hypothetical protein
VVYQKNWSAVEGYEGRAMTIFEAKLIKEAVYIPECRNLDRE